MKKSCTLHPALRPNRSDTIVTLLVVYARGTVEDPGQGHLTDLIDAAGEVRTFGIATESAAIAAWSVGLLAASPRGRERRTC